MYSTCLFCHKSLGANEVIEHLPVGRRLAFDGANGRLWVVCTACRRWNLTPIEERWEAIEECERQYRTARLRATTDEIGLSRLPEGLELVRIGKPPLAELAAWRYVDAFRRRRNQAIAAGVGSFAVLAGLVAGGYALVGTGVASNAIVQLYSAWRNRRVIHRIDRPNNARAVLRARRVADVRWLPSVGDAPWMIQVPVKSLKGPWLSLEGEAAERAMRPVLAHMNRYAGRPATVRDAVERLNRGHVPIAGTGPEAWRMTHEAIRQGTPITLKKFHAVDRLALEMRLAERDEQKLLAGQLAGLTLAWREAEEIAAIADNLLLPESVTAWLRRQKRSES